jgi:hypothetical protein
MTIKERLHQLVDELSEVEADEALEYIASRGKERATVDVERQAGLQRLAGYFELPDTAPWDWEELREGKLRAWPAR